MPLFLGVWRVQIKRGVKQSLCIYSSVALLTRQFQSAFERVNSLLPLWKKRTIRMKERKKKSSTKREEEKRTEWKEMRERESFDSEWSARRYAAADKEVETWGRQCAPQNKGSALSFISICFVYFLARLANNTKGGKAVLVLSATYDSNYAYNA